MKTFSQKPAAAVHNWYIIDASQMTLGRLASLIATYITGKHKPTYTPHVDEGDVIVVINASQLKVSGNKMIQKRYYRHSGYPGGLKSRTLEQELSVHPERVIRHAVDGMVPDNKLKSDRLQRLKIFPGTEHPHQAQQPQEIRSNA